MEIALCIIVASYFAFAFRDVQSVLYIAVVAYMLRMFINNPQLFSNGPAATTPGTITTDNTAHFDQQAPVAPSHKQLSQTLPTAATPLTQTSTTPATTSPVTARTVQRKASRYTFDPINGGVVHSPFGSPRKSFPSTSSTLASTSGLRRSHRIPDVSSGRSPFLPVLSVSPASYLPNEQHESSLVARAEVANRVVHTELVTKPELALETEQATRVEKSPHRRIGSYHQRHHHSHAHSHHRRRTSRSPMSFSDTTATGSGDHDYDSDSSRASTSSTRSTTSSQRSYGFPSYEKHVRCQRHRLFVLLFRAMKNDVTLTSPFTSTQ